MEWRAIYFQAYPSNYLQEHRTFLMCQFSPVTCKRSLQNGEENDSGKVANGNLLQDCVDFNIPLWFCLSRLSFDQKKSYFLRRWSALQETSFTPANNWWSSFEKQSINFDERKYERLLGRKTLIQWLVSFVWHTYNCFFYQMTKRKTSDWNARQIKN